MALTDHQRAILKFIGEPGREVKKSEIVDEFSYWHYCNSSKHIGDTLSRMVKTGLLDRVKVGTYRLGRSRSGTIAATISDPGQQSLF